MKQTTIERKRNPEEESQEEVHKRVRFSFLSAPEHTVKDLNNGGETVCRVYKGFVPLHEADRALETLREGLDWHDEVFEFFGKKTVAKHRVCAYGDPGLTYTYARKTERAIPWEDAPDLLSEMKARVEEAVGCKFNFCLAMYYPDGNAKLGWHADAEEKIVPCSTIASLSFGVPRPFYLRRDGDKYTVSDIKLGKGDLCIMENHCQERWKHAVPQRKRISEPRIVLTFRQMHK
jgi:alkylated DNA repair dioxygenase AlkB